jgi:hypothetical protein
MATTLYALADPTSGEVRYIGKTVAAPKARLSEHVYAAKRERNHRACWIRSVGRPEMRVLAVVTDELGAETERRAIAVFRARGARLVNGTEGGEGTPGVRFKAETRARLSEVRKAEWRSGARRSKAQPGARPAGLTFEGRRHSDEHKQRMGVLMHGRRFSIETRLKMAAAQRQRRRREFERALPCSQVTGG